jgi:hypothetical protein
MADFEPLGAMMIDGMELLFVFDGMWMILWQDVGCGSQRRVYMHNDYEFKTGAVGGGERPPACKTFFAVLSLLYHGVLIVKGRDRFKERQRIVRSSLLLGDHGLTKLP